MPDSSMPPCHTGMPCAAQRSWSRIDSANPPTRPGLMLMMRQAPAAIASRASVHGLDRLVEADRRLQPPLQRGVIDDVVVVERLLDHHQIVAIELRQMFGVVSACMRRWRRPSAGSRRSGRARVSTASTSQPGLILILMRW